MIQYFFVISVFCVLLILVFSLGVTVGLHSKTQKIVEDCFPFLSKPDNGNKTQQLKTTPRV